MHCLALKLYTGASKSEGHGKAHPLPPPGPCEHSFKMLLVSHVLFIFVTKWLGKYKDG